MRVSAAAHIERNQKLCEAVRVRQSRLSLSDRELCDKLGISRTTFYERIGTRRAPGNPENMRIGDLYKLAAILNTTPENLIKGEL